MLMALHDLHSNTFSICSFKCIYNFLFHIFLIFSMWMSTNLVIGRRVREATFLSLTFLYYYENKRKQGLVWFILFSLDYRQSFGYCASLSKTSLKYMLKIIRYCLDIYWVLYFKRHFTSVISINDTAYLKEMKSSIISTAGIPCSCESVCATDN